MSECECLAGCPFFHDKMENMPAMADIFKRKYCLGDNSQCARHIVFKTLGKSMVPSDMFPNDIEYAKAFIAQTNGV